MSNDHLYMLKMDICRKRYTHRNVLNEETEQN